ncbi:hypothetical protein [Planctomicrobium piriforme]|uniref:Uncharacterized protein n=1 Tax=Planctomicrobium piriforme TaxID=1576369 RepID=A0A1I3EF46_9PLAN|nr:hypothetical protein [Planctomicrobium piriforme]SFH97605.1 hypothetical protein SAMN05421753_104197 [Planctomicrobium piriforme]
MSSSRKCSWCDRQAVYRLSSKHRVDYACEDHNRSWGSSYGVVTALHTPPAPAEAACEVGDQFGYGVFEE